MTTANKITIFRVILIPVFLVLMYLRFPGHTYWAFGVFVLASLSDFADGYIARHYNQVSNFGKFVDPLADKMLTTAAIIYMVVDGVCSPVVLAIIMFREFAVAGVRMIAAESGTVIAANMWGKVKTVLQMVTIIFYYFAMALAPADGVGVISFSTQVLCWAVAAVTALSGCIYLWQNRSCFMQAK